MAIQTTTTNTSTTRRTKLGYSLVMLHLRAHLVLCPNLHGIAKTQTPARDQNAPRHSKQPATLSQCRTLALQPTVRTVIPLLLILFSWPLVAIYPPGYLLLNGVSCYQWAFPNCSTSKPLLHFICRSQTFCKLLSPKAMPHKCLLLSVLQLIVFTSLQHPSRQFDIQGACKGIAKGCFQADCKYFSAVDRQWTGPYTYCSRYRADLCIRFFPDWPCNGGAVLADGGAVPADVGCDCDQYSRCFTEDACAYARPADYVWSGPYTFCDKITALKACRQCFPEWPCWPPVAVNIPEFSKNPFPASSCNRTSYCSDSSFCFTPGSCAVFSKRRFTGFWWDACQAVITQCRHCFPQWPCNMPRSVVEAEGKQYQ